MLNIKAKILILLYILIVEVHEAKSQLNHSYITLVLPKEPKEFENNSATQLKKHLEKSYLNVFQIKKEDVYLGEGIKIYIGNTDFAKKNVSSNINKLGLDGILLKTIGNSIIISGQGDRGKLYAVYEFLERYSNIKFWTQSDISYPKKSKFSLKNFDYQFTPAFKYRAYYDFEANNSAEFATIMRLNGHFQPLNGEWGDPIKVLGWTHTFDQIVPVKKYFKTHPEWFSDPQNKNLPCSNRSKQPKGQETQLCLTNSEMKKEFIKNLFSWIEKNKGFDYIAISQNDRGGFCNCEECNRIIKNEGSTSGLLIKFINDIAKEVKIKYPSKKIVTLAYNETEVAPLKIKPAENVIIQIAPINSDMFHPINSIKNVSVKNNISKWSSISNELFYWGYNNNFSHELLPYPSLKRFGEDVNFLKQQKVSYVFFQGNILPNNYGYFNKMQTWVVSKLLWDPNLDINSLIKEFFLGYYGESGGDLLSYYLEVENSFKNSNSKLNAYHNDYTFISDNILTRLNSLMNNAVKKSSSTGYKQRVLEERKSNDYLNIYLNRSSDEAKIAFFQQFKPYQGKQDLSSRSLTNYSKVLETKTKSRSIANINWRNTKSITIQDDNLVLDKKGVVTGQSSDNLASDKKAVYMKATTKAWSIQLPFKNNIINEGESYVISPSIRVDAKLRKLKDEFIYIGIYDNELKSNIILQKINLSKFISDNFQQLNLQSVKLNKNRLLYFSFPKVYSEELKLYIDKIMIEKK